MIVLADNACGSKGKMKYRILVTLWWLGTLYVDLKRRVV
jgi:hypothetical protein